MAGTKKVALSVHLPPDIVAAIHSDLFGDSISHVVAERLRQAFGMGPREAAPATPMESLDLRRKEAEVAMAEKRAAIMRGEYVKKDDAFAMVLEDYGVIRSRIKIIPQQIANLTHEQLADAERAVQDCFTDLSGARSSAWDDLASDAGTNPP